jgi:hypothetical protein
MRQTALFPLVLFLGCFEGGPWSDPPPPSELAKDSPSGVGDWAWVEASRETTCAIAGTDGLLSCWGDMEIWGNHRDTGRNHGAQPPWTTPLVSLDSGTCEYCGLDASGALSCWGCREDLSQDAPSGSFELVSVSLWAACAAPASGPIQCWGQHWEGGADPDSWGQPEAPVLDLSVSRTTGCALMPDQTIACFGSDSITAPSGTFIVIEAGEYGHHCGLRTDGTVDCWGDELYTVISDVPAGVFIDITAGSSFACALDVAGEATCWGKDDEELLAPPAGPYTQISGGSNHVCGILASGGAIQCWGSENWEQFPD